MDSNNKLTTVIKKRVYLKIQHKKNKQRNTILNNKKIQFKKFGICFQLANTGP